MTQPSILLVEDETDVMLANQEYLEGKGLRVLVADTLAEAAAILQGETPDLILLDVNLPDGSGLDFFKHSPAARDIPVVFLTCRTAKQDVILGLERGGSDYITKPYDLDVMYARLMAQLRRPERRIPQRLSVGSIDLDIPAQCAYVEGEDALLKPKEFALLLYLVQNQNTVLSGDKLYGAVWGRQTNGDTRTVRVHISELRKKLRMPREGTPRIETLPQEGYRFVTQ